LFRTLAPPTEWIVDFGFEDLPVLVCTDLLRELSLVNQQQRVVTLTLAAPLSAPPHGGDARDAVAVEHAVQQPGPALCFRQALYVRRFVFVDMSPPPWFLQSFAACFRPQRCAVALAFHRCHFGDAPSSLRHIRHDFGGEDGVALQSLTFSFCKGLPVMNGGDSLHAALAPHLATLEELSIHGTYVGDCAAASLTEILAASSVLTSLDLSHSGMSEEAVKSLAHGVRASRSLKRLAIDGVPLVHGVGGLLYTAVQDCPTLTEISANCVDRSSTRFRKLLMDAATDNMNALAVA
jgi:hypothetical protein